MANYSENEIEIMINIVDSLMGMTEKRIRNLLKRKSSANPIIKKMIDRGLLAKKHGFTNGKKSVYYVETTKSRKLVKKWAKEN